MSARQSGEGTQEHVLLGYVAGVHGVRGALRVKLHNVESSTLRAGIVLELRAGSKHSDGAGAPPLTVTIARIAPKPGSDIVRLWLEGVDTREAADALRSRELYIDRRELPELESDEYYLNDLIGRAVCRRGAGGDSDSLEPLGEVVGVTSNSAQDLFVVRLRGREWLLPVLPVFIEAIEDEHILVDVHEDMFNGAS